MNILIISHYAGSPLHGMVYRYYYLARYWVKMGHRVRIVASSKSHLRKLSPVMKGKVQFEDIDGIEYAWVKTVAYSRNGLGRIANMFSFVVALFARKGAILRGFEPDVIVGSCTYNFEVYVIQRYARKYEAKLIYDVRDLWPLTLIELGGYSRKNPFVWLVQKAEDVYCRNAGKVVSVLSGAKEYLMSRGMSENKFEFIPNGIYLPAWEEEKQLSKEEVAPIVEMKNRYGCLVAYAGLHGVANSLEYLIEAVRIIRDEGVGVILIGDGVCKEELQGLAARYSLENILFLDYVDKEKISAYLKHMDILFIGWRKMPLYRFGVSPNKLFDYMMAAKPIVHAIDSVNDLVAESGCGISCEAENPQAIAESILKIASLTPDARKSMGLRGREYVIKNYDYRMLAERYVKVMSE